MKRIDPTDPEYWRQVNKNLKRLIIVLLIGMGIMAIPMLIVLILH